MKDYISIVLAMLSLACTKVKNKTNEQIKPYIVKKNNGPFKEIGNQLLPSISFAKKWYVQIYNEAEPMSKSDSINQKNLERLDFFDSIESKRITNSGYEKDLLEKNNVSKIDSIFLIDSGVWEDKKLFYFKSYITSTEKGFDFPPTEKNIDLLVYKNDALFKKVNIYSNKNYPFAAKIKLGYLDKSGILYTKSFEIDEEGVNFVAAEQHDLKKILK